MTVLATADDLAAFAWAQEHTPPDALFLVNEAVWRTVRYGTDAGWWLNLIADRRTTLPSTLYMLGAPPTMTGERPGDGRRRGRLRR